MHETATQQRFNNGRQTGRKCRLFATCIPQVIFAYLAMSGWGGWEIPWLPWDLDEATCGIRQSKPNYAAADCCWRKELISSHIDISLSAVFSTHDISFQQI